VLAKQGARSVEGFEATGKKVIRLVELKKKADAGDKAAKVEVALLGVELAQLPADEGRKQLTALSGLTPAQKKQVDAILVNYDVQDAVKGVNRNDKAATIEAGKKFAGWKKEGRIPSWDNEVGSFHSLILDYAESVKDAALFEESLEAIKAQYGKNLNPRFLDAKTKVLEQLKGGK
jgi:hypothetical protein